MSSVPGIDRERRLVYRVDADSLIVLRAETTD
jgi:Txe/YoeB family toxin of Txe-Axe toxin-antitoxin module